jgi:hypothetical protein
MPQTPEPVVPLVETAPEVEPVPEVLGCELVVLVDAAVVDEVEGALVPPPEVPVAVADVDADVPPSGGTQRPFTQLQP